MPANLKCVRLQQHLETYFMLRHPCAVVTVCPSSCKTKMYNFVSKNYTARKKFAVQKTLELLAFSADRHRGIVAQIEGASKKDDLADCILQMYALLEKRGHVRAETQK